MIAVWLVVVVAGVAAIVWGAETFAEHLAVAATRLGVSAFALAVLLAGAEPKSSPPRSPLSCVTRQGSRWVT